jgi:hypothetical protein
MQIVAVRIGLTLIRKCSILAIRLIQTVQAERRLFQVGGYHTCIDLDKTEDLIFGKKLDQRTL